jgi:hypothetical protein
MVYDSPDEIERERTIDPIAHQRKTNKILIMNGARYLHGRKIKSEHPSVINHQSSNLIHPDST